MSRKVRFQAGNAAKDGGAKRVRTADPLLAKQVLYQLSYSPPVLVKVGRPKKT